MDEDIHWEKILILSDTHIGSEETNFDSLRHSLFPHLRLASRVVFNGDLVDFSAQDKSQDILHEYAEIVRHCPHKEFYFIMGNHDQHPNFLNEIRALSSRLPNFHVVNDTLVLGNMLITHGDLLSREQTADTRCQTKGHSGEKRMRADPARFIAETLRYRAKHPLNPQQQILITDENGETYPLTLEKLADIDHIVTGHSHFGYCNLPYQGKFFHNAGSFFSSQYGIESPNDIQALVATFDGERVKEVGYAAEALTLNSKKHRNDPAMW